MCVCVCVGVRFCVFLYFAFSLWFFSLVVPDFLVFLASKGLGNQWCNVKRSCDMKILIAIWEKFPSGNNGFGSLYCTS